MSRKNRGVGRSPTLRGVQKGGTRRPLSPPLSEAKRLWGKREAVVFPPFQGLSPKLQKPALRLGVVGRERLADRRFWKPDRRVERKVDLLNRVSRLSVNLTSRSLPAIIRFKNPLKELPCIRRKVRRKVIFALKLTGKGSGARRHKFTEESKISCKG